MLRTTTGVAVKGEVQQFGQLGSGSDSAGRVVSKEPVQNHPVELAFLVMIQRAHRIYLPLTNHQDLPNPSSYQSEL